MKIEKLIWMCAVSLGIVSQGRADWDPGDPYKMHFPQLPNLTNTGRDVLASFFPQAQPPSGKIVADDWKCTETGPVTDIHIWGSWLNDAPDPAATFSLSIFTDVREPGQYSRPGQLLWTGVFGPSDYSVRLYAEASESFLDPNTGLILGPDTQVFQYNFLISDPFIQQQGTIYWLAVQAAVSPNSAFGWKTSTARYEDYAVFGVNAQPFVPPPAWWLVQELPDHTLYDMAFVITTPEPQMYGLIAGFGLGLFGLARRFLRH